MKINNRRSSTITKNNLRDNVFIKRDGRDEYIDFFRGLVIIDMIIIHFSTYFSYWPRKFVISFDFAIEGFMLIAGFMIGKHYLPRFTANKKKVSIKMLHRALQMVGIYYLMVFTIVFPYFYFLGNQNREEFKMLAIKSIFFLNQIGIIHILPTFIPLFLVCPIILYLLSKNHDKLLLILSVVLFLIGCKEPYIFNLGDKTIFPVILWQIYFCLGCYLGKKLNDKNIALLIDKKQLIYVFVLFLIIFFIKHGNFFYPELTTVREEFDICKFRKFPLNLWGLIDGMSLLFIVYSSTSYFWRYLKDKNLIIKSISVFGRNSLLIFVIHAYFVYIIGAINRFIGNTILIYICIIASFIVMCKIASVRERLT